MRRHLVLPTLLLAAIAAAPASAKTFGANLSKKPNSTATCGNSFPFAQGVTSCMGYSISPSSYAPTTGVVTKVRVRTGNFRQGPMQIVVLRSFYQNNLGDPGHPNFFCCFVQRYGPKFTPRRNRITVVSTALGMVVQPAPPPNDGNTVAKDDFLALSVLAPNVPFPLRRVSTGYAAFHAPSPRPSDTPAPSPGPIGNSQGAFNGLVIMMSAELDPANKRRSAGWAAPLRAWTSTW
jgi:hypothetical protein